MEVFQICSDCGIPFLVIDDTDSICDSCSSLLLTGVPYIRCKEKNIYEDRKIYYQWQTSARKINRAVLDKCCGVDYIQDQATLDYMMSQSFTKYICTDPLINRRFTIK